MLYSIMMIDKPDSSQLRAQTAAAHRRYMSNHVGDMRLGGPLLAEDGKTFIGSLIVKEFADRCAAEAFIAAEPYNQAGLFELVVVNAFRIAVDNSTLISEARAD